MKNGAILLIFDPRVMNEVTDPPIIRVRLSNDVIKSHFRLAAIDLDMKNSDILLIFVPRVMN